VRSLRRARRRHHQPAGHPAVGRPHLREQLLHRGERRLRVGRRRAYFNNCEIKTIGRAGANVQARNPASTYGYVFVDSRITSDAGITGNVLARIDVSAYPASHVAYINCMMGSHISAGGWTITGGTDTSMLRFWEYQSRDAAGNLVSVSGRVAGS